MNSGVFENTVLLSRKLSRLVKPADQNMGIEKKMRYQSSVVSLSRTQS